MNDHVVDTNVLRVASAAHPYSPFSESHLPVAEQQTVFEWLAAFRVDRGRRLVLDNLFRIYKEYRNKLTDQDYGLQVVHEKMQALLRIVTLSWDANDHALVPEQFQRFDRSDRKFLAAALSDPAAINIINAVDTDWLEIESELTAAGVQIVHIIEKWLRASVGGPP